MNVILASLLLVRLILPNSKLARSHWRIASYIGTEGPSISMGRKPAASNIGVNLDGILGRSDVSRRLGWGEGAVCGRGALPSSHR